MHANINRMLIGTAGVVSLLVTLCLCLYIDERQTLFRADQQKIKPAPAGVDVTVDIDTANPLGRIEDCYISFNIDSQEFSEHFEKMNFR